jgi:FKBP-type peptidyl-prolyl cis-trans isomerase SlyD
MKIENSKVVTIEYTVKDNNAQDVVIDTNVGMEPLSVIMGLNQVIPGLENELKKHSSGDSFSVVVEPKDAYGEYREEMTETYPREQFAGIDLTEGMQLFGQSEDGQTVKVMVKSFDEKTVTVDYNHILAGKTLAFEIVVLEVRDATEEEMTTGVVGGMSSCCGGEGGDSCCGGHGHDKGDDHECCGGDHSKHADGSQCCGGAGH